MTTSFTPLTILIAVENRGRAVPIARTQDPELLRQVATAAVQEQLMRAQVIRQQNAALGEVADAAARRVADVLGRFGLPGKPAAKAKVMG